MSDSQDTVGESTAMPRVQNAAAGIGLFGAAGVVVYATLVGYQALSVPVDQSVAIQSYSASDIFVMGALFPDWYGFVGLRPAAAVGIRPVPLVGAAVLWVVGITAITVAAGSFWWVIADGPVDRNLLATRLTWLLVLVAPISVTNAVFRSALRGLGGPMTYLIGSIVPFISGLGLAEALQLTLEVIPTFLVAYVGLKTMAAPVAVVYDGRRPLAALRWSFETTSRRTVLFGLAGLLSLLAGEILFFNFATSYPSPFDPVYRPEPTLTVLKTMLFGVTYASLLHLIYVRVSTA